MADVSVRALLAGDLEAMIEIDRRNSGVSRRGFFERRLQAMAAHPEAFVAQAAVAENRVVGFALAHLLDGEFGGIAPVAVLDAIDVVSERQGQGIGRRLMAELMEVAAQAGARELRTQAQWQRGGLLEFFAAAGFSLAPRRVLERGTDGVDF